MRTVTLTLVDGLPAVVLPHGRDGHPEPYPVRLGRDGAVLLSSPDGAVYEVRRGRGDWWECSCPSWRYSIPTAKVCKHSRAGALLSQWLAAFEGLSP